MNKIPGGYYLKARIIQEKKISKAPPHIREIWDYLLMNANHKDKIYGGFKIKRGQLFRTYQQIREGLAWFIGYRKMMYNENRTKKAMKFLRDNQMIVTKKELGGVLITILNYDFYQNSKNYESTNERTTERTNEEPMKNHPIPDNNKNDKNVKNDNKDQQSDFFRNTIHPYFKSIKETSDKIESFKDKKGFNPYSFVNKCINKQKIHPGAINEILRSMSFRWEAINMPWAYAKEGIKKLNGNYWEKEHIEDYEKVKQLLPPEWMQQLPQIKGVE